jgi:hypothetical protein
LPPIVPKAMPKVHGSESLEPPHLVPARAPASTVVSPGALRRPRTPLCRSHRPQPRACHRDVDPGARAPNPTVRGGAAAMEEGGQAEQA